MEFSVKDILSWTSGRLVNFDESSESVRRVKIKNISTLPNARSSDIAFFFSKEYQNEVLNAQPGVLITGEAFVEPLSKAGIALWKSAVVIACKDPYLAMALISEHFADEDSKSEVHPTAVIHPTAQVGKNVKIGPYCVVEKNCSIGDDSVLFSHVVLYANTKIGKRARLHSQTVIGSDGFGYAPVTENGLVINHQKIWHVGNVIIGDDVEIGAGTKVDRATFGSTTIGDKVKIDNHCHLAHNVKVGEGSIICGGSCLAGGAEVGKFVYIGGLCAFLNRVKIGDRAKITGMTGVGHDVPAGGVVSGIPARPHRENYKLQVLFNRLLEERKSKK